MTDFLYYKGLYKVKVVTQSEGYWIVEALEDFNDIIVLPTELHNKKTLPPMVPEHLYERRLEQKVKHMVEEYENKTQKKSSES